MTLDEIKVALRKMDPNVSDDDEAFKAQVVMMSSLQVGPNVRRLTKFTGYPSSLIHKFGHHLRKSGVWKGGRVYADWFEEDGGIAFLLDTNVALGLLARA